MKKRTLKETIAWCDRELEKIEKFRQQLKKEEAQNERELCNKD